MAERQSSEASVDLALFSVSYILQGKKISLPFYLLFCIHHIYPD